MGGRGRECWVSGPVYRGAGDCLLKFQRKASCLDRLHVIQFHQVGVTVSQSRTGDELGTATRSAGHTSDSPLELGRHYVHTFIQLPRGERDESSGQQDVGFEGRICNKSNHHMLVCLTCWKAVQPRTEAIDHSSRAIEFQDSQIY